MLVSFESFEILNLGQVTVFELFSLSSYVLSITPLCHLKLILACAESLFEQCIGPET